GHDCCSVRRLTRPPPFEKCSDEALVAAANSAKVLGIEKAAPPGHLPGGQERHGAPPPGGRARRHRLQEGHRADRQTASRTTGKRQIGVLTAENAASAEDLPCLRARGALGGYRTPSSCKVVRG